MFVIIIFIIIIILGRFKSITQMTALALFSETSDKGSGYEKLDIVPEAKKRGHEFKSYPELIFYCCFYRLCSLAVIGITIKSIWDLKKIKQNLDEEKYESKS